MLLKIKNLKPMGTRALGATLAEAHMRSLQEDVQCGRLPQQSLIIVDFDSIQATNGSYIRSTVHWLFVCGQLQAGKATELNPRHYADPRPYDLFVAVTGLGPEVCDEFQEFYNSRALPMLVAECSTDDIIERATLIGQLEPTLWDTLSKLLDKEKATAPELHASYPGEKISVTAWNNRLNDLYALRLVKRISKGRSIEYEPLARKITYGS